MSKACRKLPLYWTWVESEAALINSDGCSKVSGLHVECCWEHDLAFYYGRDPRAAYRLYIAGESSPWLLARPISFEECNARFRNCHVPRTKWGWLNPLVWIRWRGVARFSRAAWEKHSAARPVEPA